MRTGTIRRFFGDGGGVVVAIERERGGGVGAFVCDPEVAHALVQEFGTPQNGSWKMDLILGMRVMYAEDEQGVLVELRPAGTRWR